MRFYLGFSSSLILIAASCSERTVIGPGRWLDASADTHSGTEDVRIDALANDVNATFDRGDASVVCEREICGNGVDDDCDGVPENDCSCVRGDVAACYTGPRETRNVGACRDGAADCADSEFGTFGACRGSVTPQPELCDSAGVDEDCDGASNEGCECATGSTTMCGSAIGACRAGTQTCELGHLSSCTGATQGSAEACDSVDNDCDGNVDEGLTRTCGNMLGVCITGVERCSSGAWGACSGATAPVTESCDLLDNDCDGRIDEQVARACGSEVGACQEGQETCQNGHFGSCAGALNPSEESCNNLDDDCDSRTDESLARSCGTSVGICETGTQTCATGAWGICAGAVTPRTEQCDALLDEDCDGAVDEGCSCTNGATRSCGTAVGDCELGEQRCDRGAWAACLGAIGPRPEACDGVDNDCDGAIDEGCECITGTTRACGQIGGACRQGSQTCDTSGHYGACLGAIAASPEICDGVDNDCDGVTDEGCDCITGALRACGSAVGECRQGREQCDSAGHWGACTGGVTAQSETCDGRDNNCNAVTDEGCDCITGATRSCGQSGGACHPGTQTCDVTGHFGACIGAVGPSTETCDGIDNDCDGTVDEGCDCITGALRACGQSGGACHPGTQTCDGNGHFGACMGATGPSAETCDGVDNDCDGMTDEGVCFPPTVVCPPPTTVVVGLPASLSASAEDPDGGTITAQWSVTTRPSSSTANPSPATSLSTTLIPDRAGTYTLSFCAIDDENAQACCTTTVVATAGCTPPPAPTLSVCGTSWDRRPIVQFAPLPAGQTYELFADSQPYGIVTLEGQNYFRPATALDAGGPAPNGTSRWLHARACVGTCCSWLSSPVSVRMIEECTTPIAPTASNILFSEYVVDGDGTCPASTTCEAGEAIEITNLSNCPIALNGSHFSYCNGTCASSALRWMNFTAADVIPPRGVYVAIRNRTASMCSYPFFTAENPDLFGLRVSRLDMEGPNLSSGWFNNSGGAQSQLRLATGAFSTPTAGTTLARVAPYSTAAAECGSIGFDAINACGDQTPQATANLAHNQLGRLWHPCDRVANPMPANCR